MTFLNWTMLIGLAGIAIPIVIHMLNRRRAKELDWGAMRFLLAALSARKRRIRLEEILLLALRCFLMALLAIAMARPFLPSTSTISWTMVLPAILAAAILGAVGTAMWDNRKARWWLLVPAALLLAGAIALSIVEYHVQRKRWSLGEQGQDIAIVIDGSMSMTLAGDVGEKLTNFQRAVNEARAVLAACRPSDAVSVILAGSSPRPVIFAPSYDRSRVRSALAKLQPTGGSMRVIDALTAAAGALSEGANPTKKIILITDGQNVGWDVSNTARWKFLAGTLKGRSGTSPMEIVCRTLPMPASFTNAGIKDITFSRRVIGTFRPVTIDVTVMNTSAGEVSPSRVELSIDSGKAMRQDVSAISPNAAETVHFEYRFTTPGRHLVTARVIVDDDMPADNVISRVVDVTARLRVLIVDGSPSARPLDSASAFIDLALSPPPPADDAPAAGSPSRGDRRSEGVPGNLIDTKVIDATEIASVKNFGRYDAVVLADVARLPGAVARAIAAYVRRGGGLLLAMGGRCEADFYNAWRSPAGEAMLPAELIKRVRAAVDQPVRLAPESFQGTALRKIADYPRSDVGKALIKAYWSVSADRHDPAVLVAAALNTSQPAIIERKRGGGIVIQTVISLDRYDANLHVLKSFVPLMHELIYQLVAASMVEGNVSPGADVTIALPERLGKDGKPLAAGAAAGTIEVVAPDGSRAKPVVLASGNVLRVRFGPAAEPGVYRLVLGGEYLRQYQAPAAGVPFVVVSDPRESRIETLSAADRSAIGRYVPLRNVAGTSELVATITGSIPGDELWRQLALAALAVLVAEIFLTRWIAVRRRLNSAETVRFGVDAIDMETFRDRAKQLLEVPARSPETAGKT